jgi:hypothetical protein
MKLPIEHPRLAGSFLTFLWLVLGVGLGSAAAQDVAEDFFETKIRPILLAKCVECHGPDQQEGGLRLDTRAHLLQGGGSGPAILEANAAESLLLKAVSYQHEELQMPPDGPLAADTVAALQHWVSAGAPWPESVAMGSPLEARLLQDRERHWAFQPLQRSNPADWTTGPHPIDQRIAQKLREQGLEANPPAEDRTLVRRLYLTLIGLPPTPAELDAYLADTRPDRWSHLIDDLLARPQYGERWARHWLDVARYADTQGYAFAKDRSYPHAYTYRDYVVRAFNADLPYDQFVLQQLAADQLDLGDDLSPLAALGFITVGRRFIDHNDTLDDRIDAVTRGLLGLTVSCARCHDHKYDAVSAADYYALYGVLASSPDVEVKPPIGPKHEVEALQAYEVKLREIQGRLDGFLDAQVAATKQHTIDRLPDYFLAAHQPPAGMDLENRDRVALQADDLRPAMVRRWRERLDRMARPRQAESLWFRPWRTLIALPDEEFATHLQAQLAIWQSLADGTATPSEQDEDAGNALESEHDRDTAQAAATEANAGGTEAAESAPPVRRPRLNRRPIDAQLLQQLQAAQLQSKQDVARFFADVLRDVWKTFQEHGANDAAVLKVDAPLRFAIELFRGDSPINVAKSEIGLYVTDADYETLKTLKTALDEHKATAPADLPRAMTVVERQPPVDPYVFLRSNPNNRGPAVPRRYLTLLSRDNEPTYPADRSGRLELARQLVDRDNPLTARVIVNRVWMHHFGRPLVATPSDFGVRCDQPDQLELLDFLADYLQHHHWSLKALHRLILTSHTFQQKSQAGPEAVAADPTNRWYSRMNRRRLEWEALRDSLLLVTGQLDGSIGGPAVDLFRSQASSRRSLYGTIDRQDLPNLLRSFDFASPDTSVAMRPQTTVPQQSLYLMNGPLVADLAGKLLANPQWQAQADPEAQLHWLFQRILLRRATVAEVDRCLQFLAQVEVPVGVADDPAAPLVAEEAVVRQRWQMLVQALLMSNEFSFVD